MSFEIKQRTNGVWAVHFKDETGKRKRVSLGTRDESAARSLGRDVYIKHFTDDEEAPEAAPKSTTAMTLGQAIDKMKRGAWSAEQASSWQTIWSDCKLLLEYFGDVPLKEITSDVLQGFVDQGREQGLAGGTILKRLSRIRTILIRAHSSWINPKTHRPYIPYVPHFPEGVTKAKPRKKELTEDEERQVFALCDDKRETTERAQTWWLFKQFLMWQIDTGMRKGETLGKTMADVQGDSVILYDGETKNEDGREVPLTTRLQQLVSVLDSMGITGKLFAGLNKGKIQEMWNVVRDELELGDITIHDLRHTRGQRLADAGVPIEVIADLLGHRDISITARVYTFRKSETLRKWTDHADREAVTLTQVS